MASRLLSALNDNDCGIRYSGDISGEQFLTEGKLTAASPTRLLSALNDNDCGICYSEDISGGRFLREGKTNSSISDIAIGIK